MMQETDRLKVCKLIHCMRVSFSYSVVTTQYYPVATVKAAQFQPIKRRIDTNRISALNC